MVHEALNRIPGMFQVWECKHVMNIAPTNGNHPWEPDLCPLCPSPKLRSGSGDLFTYSTMQTLMPSGGIDALDRSSGALAG
jgi:hypothetical protein